MQHTDIAREGLQPSSPAADTKHLRTFRSLAGRERYLAAYDERLRQWPVVHTELDVPTRFGTTHVIASGPPDAPPLVLLATMLGSATLWRPNVAALSRHYRTYAVDVIGEPNKSRPTKRIWTRRGFAAWMTDLLDALHIQRAHIVGNSYGGFLALNQVLHTPDRVERIVLISPAGTFARLPLKFFYHFFLGGLLRSRRRITRALAWSHNGVLIAPPEESWTELMKLALLEGLPQNFVRPKVFSRTELLHVRTPTLLLIGEKESLYAPEPTVQRARACISGLEAAVVPGANHCAGLTQPEEINRRILAFLAQGAS